MDPQIIRESVEVWSPGGQASADQDHAEAIDAMRRCKTFLLCFVEDDAGERDYGGGFYIGTQGTAIQAFRLLAATEQAHSQLTRLIRDHLIPLVIEANSECPRCGSDEHGGDLDYSGCARCREEDEAA